MKNHPSLLQRIPAFLLATLLTLPSVFTSAAVDVLPADTPATTPAATSTAAASAAPKAPEVGDIAPDFAFTDFNGKEHHLSEFRGKHVLLDIWATWCGPCVAEIPTLRAIHAELADKGFVVLSVSIDDSSETAKAYVAKNNMPWTHGYSSGAWKSDIARKFRINAIPSVWFIGADGKIKAYDLRGTEAKNAARSLLQNKLNFTPVPKVKVSGLVVDEKGKPIAGAKVFLYPTSNVNSCTYTGNLVVDWTFTTDANGVWTCEKMFADVKELHIGAYHHDYIASREQYYPGEGIFKLEKFTSIPDFLAGKQKTVLYSGVRITGIVRDADGKPKAGVPVYIGEDHVGGFHTPPEITNEKGEFSYAVRSESTAYFTITPEGFAPDMKTVQSVVKAPHVEFTLQPAQTIKGIIVDENGKPLPKVWINLDRWRGARSISYHSESDSQGRFEVKNMPADAVLFGFELKNFSSNRNVPLKAGKKNKIVMVGATKIFGKVVDAETGKELKKYKVEIGEKFKGGSIHWKRRESEIKYFKENNQFKISPTGVFSIVIKKLRESFVFRIKADGYASATSDVVNLDGKTHELVIKLTKRASQSQEEDILITIRDSNGNALKNVNISQIFQTKRDDGTSYYSGTFISEGEIFSSDLRSRADGTFVISATEENFNLTLSHPAGWASIHSKELKNGMNVVLTPWQTIQGKAFVGDKPDSGVKISYHRVGRSFLSNRDEPLDQISCTSTAVADANGNFEIKHAIPGFGFIGTEREKILTKKFFLPAGKKHEVYLGPAGRPVKGRLLVPAKLNDKKRFPYYFTIQREDVGDGKGSTPVLRELDPLRKKKLTGEEKDAEERQFWEREERLQLRQIPGNGGSIFSDDNSFLIENVLPGKYVLELQNPFKAKRTFEVKLDPGKLFMKEPVDLGELNFDADYAEYLETQKAK